ncbi:nitroreductase family deazaflavin-dependent oxidoreductase [Streptomyces sp. NBC_00006]|uniref:nitroreductase/quinone reductase family protein n=1 Tax=Streptomyces sp. NBC_00006 TaxID=2975619 RepID=UPI002255F148|nr:nitroreductase/quinone reductase family protein [Streptomyces sp. NBC_00006]MCX5536440.1 nitroreductase family deazaflavin-dependent oxidoreductase [Streptomyces sp. NBC_00006]
MPAQDRTKAPWLPPRWFIRLAWSVHRGAYRASGGRVGLWKPRLNKWGTLRLTTTGRRTGRLRGVIVAYVEDGPRLVTLAMNGWGEGEPAWWLNLRAHPEAIVHTVNGRRVVRGRAATGDERARLWDRWRETEKNLDAHAAKRSFETTVVVLEPLSGTPHGGSPDASA